MSDLIVNVDLGGILRTVSRKSEPDPAQIAMLAELFGANGVSIQFRRDKKYIREKDLFLLKGIIKSKFTIELPPHEDTIAKIMEIKPTSVIISADHADSDTPLSPIDFNNSPVDYSMYVNQLSAVGISTGFFIEPEIDEVKGVAKSGAPAVFINCAGYTNARSTDEAQHELDRIDKAAQFAGRQNLHIIAGRGIDYKNIQPLLELKLVDDFIVGNAICARAILLGMEHAVKEMKQLIDKV
ncbi:MAG: hypothetical protein DWP97_03875 [Calditrichaeota bacterium]|nr:MAG: hypothetical protein DWP97_03875 [Calditrichota bacterium]